MTFTEMTQDERREIVRLAIQTIQPELFQGTTKEKVGVLVSQRAAMLGSFLYGGSQQMLAASSTIIVGDIESVGTGEDGKVGLISLVNVGGATDEESSRQTIHTDWLSSELGRAVMRQARQLVGRRAVVYKYYQPMRKDPSRSVRIACRVEPAS